MNTTSSSTHTNPSVLVIGGAGYIGSHVILALQSRGIAPIVIDDFSTGKRAHISDTLVCEQGSILDTAFLDRVCSKYKPSCIIHLAAKKAAGESMTNAPYYASHNITGTINILNAMVKHHIASIVFSSSAAVYGIPTTLPVKEQASLNPLNFYGKTKQIIEELLRWYNHIHAIRYIALRYFNAAGHDPNTELNIVEENPQNLIPILLEVATGIRDMFEIYGNDYPTQDGTCVRDYIHVHDIAQAHYLSYKYLQAPSSEPQILNLGTGKGYSVKEVYDCACTVTGTPIPHRYAPRRPGDVAEIYASSLRAHEVLGWKPHYTDIKDMVQHAWDKTRA